MTYEYICPSCNAPIQFDFTPSRPAPCCSNHDSPAFSDPGDAAECEGPEECPHCREEIDQDKVIELAEEHFQNNP